VPLWQIPRQKRPVDRHVEEGQCASFEQGRPWLAPPTQTFCVARQLPPPPQLKLVSQHPPANGPLAQVPKVASVLQTGDPEHVLPGHEQAKLSSVPPSHTPCASTHTPPGQSSSVLHGWPSLLPPAGIEHRKVPSCAAALRYSTVTETANRLSAIVSVRFTLVTVLSRRYKFFRLFTAVSQQESCRPRLAAWRLAPCACRRYRPLPGRRTNPTAVGASWSVG
jgi:hypothetical protein